MSEKKKKFRWLRIMGIIILAILIAGGVYGYNVYKSFKNTVETMNQPIESKQTVKRVKPVTLTKKEPFSVLMLGVDQRPGDRGRSDSIIVLAVNPTTKSVKMLSIPRDTRTEIIGKGTVDKINHAYAFGGVPMSMNTVEKFLDIPIDYYIQINMSAFKDVVNAVGGVTVHNNLDFTQDGFHFPVGDVTLNGDMALSYSRMRHEDPRGDFGRQARQREILQAVLKEGTSLSTLTNYSNIFTALGKNIRTNLTFNQIMDIQKNYKDAGKNIQQMEIQEKGTMINKIYYGLVSPAEKQRVRSKLKTQLELK